ncbi:hypothetical protein ACE939_14655 [Aquimarina sp. W85]|uniref:hypothetical protein n=1 Tax=Aquimarina rhodophyticola TaxID=3342246 RepID=UPI00366DB8A8
MKKEFLLILSSLFLLCNCLGTSTATTQQLVTLQITPKQCEAPWQNNIGNSAEERLKAFLNEQSIELLSYTEKNLEIMTCSACGCPGNIQYNITVPQNEKTTLIKQGFIEVGKK